MSQAEPEQEPEFEEQEKNHVARTPVVTINDVSGSMTSKTENHQGKKEAKIDQLNKAFPLFKEEISKEFKAEESVDVAVVSFGNDEVTVEEEFTSVTDFEPPTLSAGGGTPLCEALITGVNYLDEYRNHLRDNYTPLNKGLIWLLTDGRPTDEADPWSGSGADTMWDMAQNVIAEGTENGDLLFYGVGIGSKARTDKLEDLVSAAPDQSRVHVFQLDEGQFREWAKKMSESASGASKGQVENAGDMIAQD